MPPILTRRVGQKRSKLNFLFRSKVIQTYERQRQGRAGLRRPNLGPSAEYWLKLGQPAEALMELERLPENVRNHPWAVKVHVAAIGAARELDQVTVQE